MTLKFVVNILNEVNSLTRNFTFTLEDLSKNLLDISLSISQNGQPELSSTFCSLSNFTLENSNTFECKVANSLVLTLKTIYLPLNLLSSQFLLSEDQKLTLKTLTNITMEINYFLDQPNNSI